MSNVYNRQILGRLLHPVVRRLCSPFVQGLVPVFMIHRIADPARGVRGVDPKFLDAALDWLRRNGYRTVSLEELVTSADPIKGRAVAFTMDDGFADQAEIAAPIFLKYRCPVTMFLITGFLDGELWPWDDQVDYVFSQTRRDRVQIMVAGQPMQFSLRDAASRKAASRAFRERCKRVEEQELIRSVKALSESAGVDVQPNPPIRYKPMTWAQARELEGRGFRFGPHSISHRILKQMKAGCVEAEIMGSWERIRTELTQPLKLFAFPTGRAEHDFSEREIALLSEQQFWGAVSSDPGYVNQGSVLFNKKIPVLPRFSFPGAANSFIQYCEGLERIKEILRRDEPASPNAKTGVQWKFRIPEPPDGIRRQVIDITWKAKLHAGGFHHYKEIRWKDVNRLVFVCKGNICRSAFAEGIAKRHYESVVSCGLSTRGGDPADKTAQFVAKRWAIDLSQHRTQPIHSLKIGPGDLLLAMDPRQSDLLKNFGFSPDVQVTLLGLWAVKPCPSIPDPYGQHDSVFEKCFLLISNSIVGVLSNINTSYALRDNQN